MLRQPPLYISSVKPTKKPATPIARPQVFPRSRAGCAPLFESELELVLVLPAGPLYTTPAEFEVVAAAVAEEIVDVVVTRVGDCAPQG